MVKKNSGYTLVELLVVSAIVAFILSLGSTLFIKMDTFFRISIAKIETQRDVRNLMTLISQDIRQAKASQITLSKNDASQPPYSKITFKNTAGDTIVYWQDGRTLCMSKNGATSMLANNLRSLFISYPATDNPNLITILVSVEKKADNQRTFAMQMGGETIRLLND